MAHELTRIDAEKNRIVTSLFIDTADQNYVVARWCFLNGLYLDFYWNGAHALEKFMKAVLLLNGRSSIKPNKGRKYYGHDLISLYTELQTFADDLLPMVIPKPNELNIYWWRAETAVDFVKRFSEVGDAHNRYQIFGYSKFDEDLYKFDRMVFSIRRLCCALDAYYLGKKRDGQPTFTNRDVLTRQPDYQPNSVGSHFEKLIGKKATDAVRQAALKHNLLFAPNDYDHGSLRESFSSSSAVLWRSILSTAQQGKAVAETRETVEVLDWVTANIHLPADVRKQLFDARKTMSGTSP